MEEISTDVSSQESLPNESQEQPSLVDLDSQEKFKWQGREWTPKELQSAHLAHTDYTKKTMALAEERKFYDNLSADLEYISKNPNPKLLEDFKSIYPEKFHSYLRYVESKVQQQQVGQPQQNPELSEFKTRFEKMEKALHDKEVEAINAKLDVTFKELKSKYPLSNEKVAVAMAQDMLRKGENLNDDAWGEIFKTIHEEQQKLFDEVYSKKVKEQKTANANGKDIGSGGGTVGHAPKMPKTIREASEGVLAEL